MAKKKQSSIQQNLDRLYKLKRYPFSIQDYDISRAGLKQEWEQLLLRIDQAANNPGNDIIVILGDYGIGKTYTLWQLHKKYREDDRFLVVPPLALMSSENTSRFTADLVGRTLKQIGYDRIIDILRQTNGTWEQFVTNPSVLDLLSSLAGDDDAARNKALSSITGELVKRCRLFYGGSFRPHPRVTRIIGHVR